MPFPKIFSATCPCNKRNKISLTIIVDECPGEGEAHQTQQPCPHAFETYCHKYVNVTLPPGIRPEKDIIDRNYDELNA
jgi:hypothetical protein